MKKESLVEVLVRVKIVWSIKREFGQTYLWWDIE
jgi:hypothetical protein